MDYFQVLNLIFGIKTLNIIGKESYLNENHSLSVKNSYQTDKPEFHFKG